MTFTPSSPETLFAFLTLMGLVLCALVLGAKKYDTGNFKTITGFLLLWNALASAFVLSGIIQTAFIPFGPMLFASLILTAILFSNSALGKSYDNAPFFYVILFQSFRLPLELILHHWAETQTVPATMTWTGQNFDVVTGLLALLVLLPPLQNKKFYWVFNIVGIALLLNVIRVVILSSPLPFAWGLDNPIQLIAYFPYQLIGTVGVWSAIVGHFILTRKLLTSKN